MNYIIDNKEIHNEYTTRVHNIAKARIYELIGERLDDKDDTREMVEACGTLINIEVF